MIDRRCPGGPAVSVDPVALTARCPGCGFELSTLMDHPVVPPHWVLDDGEVVVFGP